jgi:hypothetical protein
MQRRGHAIQLIASDNFEAIVLEYAVPFAPLPGDYKQLLASKQGLQLMQGMPVVMLPKLVPNDPPSP